MGAPGSPPRRWRRSMSAEMVFGGERHLALVGPIAAETRAWPSPLSKALPAILAERGRTVCVLATGDPFHYGVGVQLAGDCGRRDADIPQPSAFALACSPAVLGAAGLRAGLAAWPGAAADHSASAARRAHAGAVLGRNDAGQAVAELYERARLGSLRDRRCWNRSAAPREHITHAARRCLCARPISCRST